MQERPRRPPKQLLNPWDPKHRGQAADRAGRLMRRLQSRQGSGRRLPLALVVPDRPVVAAHVCAGQVPELQIIRMPAREFPPVFQGKRQDDCRRSQQQPASGGSRLFVVDRSHESKNWVASSNGHPTLILPQTGRETSSVPMFSNVQPLSDSKTANRIEEKPYGQS